MSSDRVILSSSAISVDDFFFTKGTQAKRLLAFINYLSLGYVETCNAIVGQMQVRLDTHRAARSGGQQQRQCGGGEEGNHPHATHGYERSEGTRIDAALLPVFRSLLTAVELRSLTAIGDWGVCDAEGSPLPIPPITANFRIAKSPLAPSAESAAYSLIMGSDHREAAPLPLLERDGAPKDGAADASVRVNMDEGCLLRTDNAPLRARTVTDISDRDMADRQLPIIIATLVRSLVNSIDLLGGEEKEEEGANSAASSRAAEEAGHKEVLRALTNFILDHDADSLGALDFSRFASLVVYLHLVHFNLTDEDAASAEKKEEKEEEEGASDSNNNKRLNASWRPTLRLLSLLWFFTKKFVSVTSYKEFLGQLKMMNRRTFEAEEAARRLGRLANAGNNDAPFAGDLLSMMPPLRLASLLLAVFGDEGTALVDASEADHIRSAEEEEAIRRAELESYDASEYFSRDRPHQFDGRSDAVADPFTIRPEVFTVPCPMNDTATPGDLSFARHLLLSSHHTRRYIQALDDHRYTHPELCPFTRCRAGKLEEEETDAAATAASRRERDAEDATWAILSSSKGAASSPTTTDDYVDALLSQPEGVFSLLLARIRRHVMALYGAAAGETEEINEKVKVEPLEPLLPFLRSLLDAPRNHHMRPFVCYQLYFNPADDALRTALFSLRSDGSASKAPALTLEDHILIIDYLSGDYFSGLLPADATSTAAGNKKKEERGEESEEALVDLQGLVPKGASRFIFHPCFEMHAILQHFVKLALLVQKALAASVSSSANSSSSSAYSGGAGPAESVLASLIASRGDVLSAILSITEGSSAAHPAASAGTATAADERTRLALLQQIAANLTQFLNSTRAMVKIAGGQDDAAAGKKKDKNVGINKNDNDAEEESADPFARTLFAASPAYASHLAQQLSFLRAIQLLQSVSKFISQKSAHITARLSSNDDSNATTQAPAKTKASDEPPIDPKQWKDIAASFYEALALASKHAVVMGAEPPSDAESPTADGRNPSALAGIVVELILTVATDQILLPTLQIQQQERERSVTNSKNSEQNEERAGISDGISPLVEESMELYCQVIDELEHQLAECISPRVLSVLRIVIFKARQLLDGNSGGSADPSAPGALSNKKTASGETLLVAGGGATANSLWDLSEQQLADQQLRSPSSAENGAQQQKQQSPAQLLLSAFSASPTAMLIGALVPHRDYDKAFKVLTHLFSTGEADGEGGLWGGGSEAATGDSGVSSKKKKSQQQRAVRSDSVLLFAYMSAQLDNLRRGDITIEDFLALLDDITDVLLTAADRPRDADGGSRGDATAAVLAAEAPALVCRADLWMHSPQQAQPLAEALAEDVASAIPSGDNNASASHLKHQVAVLQSMALASAATTADAAEESEGFEAYPSSTIGGNATTSNALVPAASVPYFVQFTSIYLQPHMTKGPLTAIMASLSRAKRIAASATTSVADFIASVNTIAQSVHLASAGADASSSSSAHVDPSKVWKSAFARSKNNNSSSSKPTINYLAAVGKHLSQLECIITTVEASRNKQSAGSNSGGGKSSSRSVQQLLTQSHTVLFGLAKAGALTTSALRPLFSASSSSEEAGEKADEEGSLAQRHQRDSEGFATGDSANISDGSSPLTPTDLLSIIVSEYIASQLAARPSATTTTTASSLTLSEEVNVLRAIEQIAVLASAATTAASAVATTGPRVAFRPTLAPLLLLSVSNRVLDYLAIFSKQLALAREDGGCDDATTVSGATNAASSPVPSLASDSALSGNGDSDGFFVARLSDEGIFASLEAQSTFMFMLLGLQRALAVDALAAGAAGSGLASSSSIIGVDFAQIIASAGGGGGYPIGIETSSVPATRLVAAALDPQRAAAPLIRLLVGLASGGANRSSGKGTSAEDALFRIFELTELPFLKSAIFKIFSKCRFDVEEDEEGEGDKNVPAAGPQQQQAEEAYGASRLPTVPISRSQFAANMIDALLRGFERSAQQRQNGEQRQNAVSAVLAAAGEKAGGNQQQQPPALASLAAAIFGANSVADLCQTFIAPLVANVTELPLRCRMLIPTSAANAPHYLRFASLVPFETQAVCVESAITALYIHRQRLAAEEGGFGYGGVGGGGGDDEAIVETLEALHSRGADLARMARAVAALSTLQPQRDGEKAAPSGDSSSKNASLCARIIANPVPLSDVLPPAATATAEMANTIPSLVEGCLAAAGFVPDTDSSTSDSDNDVEVGAAGASKSDPIGAALDRIANPKIPLPSPKAVANNPRLRAAIEALVELLLTLRLALPAAILPHSSSTSPPSSSEGTSTAPVPPGVILRQMARLCASLLWITIQADIPQLCSDALHAASSRRQQQQSGGGPSSGNKLVIASNEENKSQKRRELRLLERINAVVNTEFTVRNAQGGSKLSFSVIYKALTDPSGGHCGNHHASGSGGNAATTNASGGSSAEAFTCAVWELVDLVTTSDRVAIETQHRLVTYLVQSALLRPIFVVDQHWAKTILGLDMMRVLKERQINEKRLLQSYKKACEERTKLPGTGNPYGDDEDDDEDEDAADDGASDSDDEEDTIDSVFGRTFASEPLLLVENLLMCQRIADVAAILPLVRHGRERECDRLLLKYAHKAVDVSAFQRVAPNAFPNGKKPEVSAAEIKNVPLPLKPPRLRCWIPSDCPPKQQTEIRTAFEYTNTPNMPLYRQIVRYCHDQEAAMEASFAFAESLFDSLEDTQNNVTKVLIIDTAEHVLMSLLHRTEKHIRLLRMFQISRHLVVCSWPEHPQREVFSSQEEVMGLIDKLLAADHTQAAFAIAEVCGVDIGGVQTLWTDRVRELLELSLFTEAEEAMAHLTADKAKEMVAYIKTAVQLTPVVTGYRAQRNSDFVGAAGGGGGDGGGGHGGGGGGARRSNQQYSVRQVTEADVPSLLIAQRNGIASILKKYGSRMDLLEFHMNLRDYIPAIGIALECRKEFESEVAEIFLRQSVYANATGELRKAMREKDPTLATLRPLLVLSCKALESDGYMEELYTWQKWMHDYSRAAHTATALSGQEARLAEKMGFLKEAERFFMDAKTQPTIKLPDPPFADDGVELPITRMTPQQLHFSLIQVRLQQQLVTALHANGLDFNSMSLYCDYSKLGEVAQSLLTSGKLPLVELSVTIMDSFHVDVMTTMTRSTLKLLEEKRFDPIETLVEQCKRILSLSPADRNAVLYSMLQVCYEDPNKRAQKLAVTCLGAMTQEGGRRIVALLRFGKHQQAMAEAVESKDYKSVESVYETVNKMTPMTPELQQIVDQTRHWLTRNRR